MSKIKSVFIGGVVGLMTCCTGCESKQKEYQNWEIYGGTKDNIRYSKRNNSEQNIQKYPFVFALILMLWLGETVTFL